jgi:hypothetical protein
VLVVAPAGASCDPDDLGAALFGNAEWERVHPPLQNRELKHIPRYLVGAPSFTFEHIAGTWHEFLDSVYDSVNLVLFYSGLGEQYYEVPRDNLELRRPEHYTFSLFQFRKLIPHSLKEDSDMADEKVTKVMDAVRSLLSAGWTASAISNASGVNPITIGNIKNGKAQRVTSGVYNKLMDVKNKADQSLIAPPARGRKPAAAAKPAPKAKPGPKPKAKPGPKPKGRPGRKPGVKSASPASSIINTNYVPVDVTQLQAAIDSMIKNFSGAIKDLEGIKKQLKI